MEGGCRNNDYPFTKSHFTFFVFSLSIVLIRLGAHVILEKAIGSIQLDSTQIKAKYNAAGLKNIIKCLFYCFNSDFN